VGYVDQNGNWHPKYLTNAELIAHPLPSDSAKLAETFDATCWGEDGGRVIAKPLLAACATGVLPESLTLLRTCLHIQSRIVRVRTQDDDAPDEVALLHWLAAAVRERVATDAIDQEAAVVAEQLTAPERPISSRIYEDPTTRPAKSLLLGLLSQAATTLQHPLENQLSEVLAFLIDRDQKFAGRFLSLCAGETDAQLLDAVTEAQSIGARTRISLPSPAPGGLPQRRTLFPDISIEGAGGAFQVFVEAKVDADLHRTTIDGISIQQPDAYAYAWRRINEPDPPKVRRVCTLTREQPAETSSDPWRCASITWREVAALTDGEASDELKIIGSELATLINTAIYPPLVDAAALAYVKRVGPLVLNALTGQVITQLPTVTASAVTSHRDYVGRYLTIPASAGALRIWLYATPPGGRYNTPNRETSIVWGIADGNAEWTREQIEATADRLSLKLERDIAGFRLFRDYLPFPLGLDPDRAAAHGQSLAEAVAEALAR
jgi:hypothetical protein